MTGRGRRASFAVAFLLLAGAFGVSTASPVAALTATRRAVPRVEVSGPVQGGAGQQTAAVQDLAARGYVESEYFFEGTAPAYAGARKPNGVWDAHVAARAEYRSRMIVRRPQDPARFSGTVVVEWLNVTIGRDGDPSWGYSAEEIMREGHAWVGVSAQASGVRALAEADPPRYGSLDHPGDAYSYGIFTEAARALTRRSGTAPLGDLKPQHLIAIGQSQSAAFLIPYLDGIQPLVRVFDGFLMHTPAQAARIRTDLEQPTLVFLTETELTNFGYASARQPDTHSVRTWEVAGAAHADAWLLNEAGGGYADSCPSLNDGPHRQALRAALHHLVTWVKTGETPPRSPRIRLAAKPANGRVAVIERDEHGNAVGGIRTPYVDAPVSALSGDALPGSPPLCRSFGTTTPFDAATLARLYPTHDVYVEAFTESTEAAVEAGFILQPDADEMIATAQQSTIGAGD